MNIQVTVNSINVAITPLPPPPPNWHYYADLATGRER